jgi:hypothetical protein
MRRRLPSLMRTGGGGGAHGGRGAYLVESVLKHGVVRHTKSRRPALQYLVMWLCYPVWDCTLEPESHFPRGPEALLD